MPGSIARGGRRDPRSGSRLRLERPAHFYMFLATRKPTVLALWSDGTADR
jgi:hypothetical protein